MIKLSDITIGYADKVLVSDISCTFQAGEMCVLLGRNGCGKSTLLRAMMGIGKTIGGEITINGQPVRGLSAAQLSKEISLVTTERVRISNLSCRQVVSLGRSPYTNWIGRLEKEDMQIVDKALKDVNMTDYAQRSVDSLSDGEYQRIMIARALAQSTSTIMLDEPTAFLDIPTRYEICRLLGHLAHNEGKCIIFSTHDLDSALSAADTVALIEQGKLYKYEAGESREALARVFGI